MLAMAPSQPAAGSPPRGGVARLSPSLLATMSHSDFSTGRHLGLLALSLRLPAGAAAPTEPAEISLGYARDCSHRAGGHVPGRRVLCRASPLAGRLARPSRPFHRSRLSGTPAQCLPPALRLQASRPVNCLWLQKVRRLHSSFRWDLNPLVTCAARRTLGQGDNAQVVPLPVRTVRAGLPHTAHAS